MNSRMRLIVPASALALSCLLTGCGLNNIASTVAAASPSIAGNWDIAANAAPGSLSQIASVGGALMVSSSGSVTGILHTIPASGQTASSLCFAPTNNIPVTGTYSSSGQLTLTSANFAGNTMTVSGTYVAASGTTQAVLNNATFTIAGSCGVAVQTASAVQYAAVGGTYSGTFSTGGGGALPVSSTLTQTSQPDANGTYHLQGSATFTTPADMCISSSVVTDSTVNGNSFSATYTDPNSLATVMAVGTFNAAATRLTITNWTLTGTTNCMANGIGVLNQKTAS